VGVVSALVAVPVEEVAVLPVVRVADVPVGAVRVVWEVVVPLATFAVPPQPAAPAAPAATQTRTTSFDVALIRSRPYAP
jgi:hypothetical protein